jgi:hypothetical protein
MWIRKTVAIDFFMPGTEERGGRTVSIPARNEAAAVFLIRVAAAGVHDKISAVRVIRKEADCGLKDAYDFVNYVVASPGIAGNLVNDAERGAG